MVRFVEFIFKCKILYIGKNNQEIDYKIKLSEDNYDNVGKCEGEKDLGVIFDKYLSFDSMLIIFIMVIFKILLTRLTV